MKREISDIELLIKHGFNDKAGSIQAHPSVAFVRGRLGMRWAPTGHWVTRDNRKIRGTLRALLAFTGAASP